MRTIALLCPVLLCLALPACKPAAPTGTATTADQAPATVPAAQAQAPTPATTEPRPTVLRYLCDGLAVDARFPARDRAEVWVDGRTLALGSVEAASGARYTDADGNELWTKGEAEASFKLAGDARPRSCKPAPAPAPGGFRAVGNEPGWMAEAIAGPPARLRLELDYGQRKLEVANATADDKGWSGTASDGSAVTLGFERTPCEDVMSGQKFDARARLVVGDKTYEGCGNFAR